jgi:hypothetical protein
MKLDAVPLSSPIEEKLAWAKHLHTNFGKRVLEDKVVVDLSFKLKNAIEASHDEMRGSGILEICRECDQKEGGSCCGVGLENRYDSWLLLINLLMGIELPTNRSDPKSCFFLTDTGCLLKARHVICVNYLCTKITDQINPQEIAALREREGRELDMLFGLHERIKKVIREWMRS